MNGSLVLPIGPNKLLFSNTSERLRERAIEGWQMGWIVNVNSGQPSSVAAQSMLYALGTLDIVGPFLPRKGDVQFDGPVGYYFPKDAYKIVDDPHCAQGAAVLAAQCSIDAIQDAKTGQMLLQHPKPGTRGNLGQAVTEGPGQWRFDANLMKRRSIVSSKLSYA